MKKKNTIMEVDGTDVQESSQKPKDEHDLNLLHDDVVNTQTDTTGNKTDTVVKSAHSDTSTAISESSSSDIVSIIKPDNPVEAKANKPLNSATKPIDNDVKSASDNDTYSDDIHLQWEDDDDEETNFDSRSDVLNSEMDVDSGKLASENDVETLVVETTFRDTVKKTSNSEITFREASVSLEEKFGDETGDMCSKSTITLPAIALESKDIEISNEVTDDMNTSEEPIEKIDQELNEIAEEMLLLESDDEKDEHVLEMDETNKGEKIETIFLARNTDDNIPVNNDIVKVETSEPKISEEAQSISKADKVDEELNDIEHVCESGDKKDEPTLETKPAPQELECGDNIENPSDNIDSTVADDVKLLLNDEKICTDTPNTIKIDDDIDANEKLSKNSEILVDEIDAAKSNVESMNIDECALDSLKSNSNIKSAKQDIPSDTSNENIPEETSNVEPISVVLDDTIAHKEVIVPEEIVTESESNKDTTTEIESISNDKLFSETEVKPIPSDNKKEPSSLSILAKDAILDSVLKSNEEAVAAPNKPEAIDSKTDSINKSSDQTDQPESMTIDPDITEKGMTKADTLDITTDITEQVTPKIDNLDIATDIAEEITPTTDNLESTEKVVEMFDQTKPLPIEENLESDDIDVADITDSLGLLAESSRVMEEDPDDEQEDVDDDDDNVDDDDDDDTQMTEDQSEDSNTAANSETDLPKETGLKSPDIDTAENTLQSFDDATRDGEMDVDVKDKDGDSVMAADKMALGEALKVKSPIVKQKTTKADESGVSTPMDVDTAKVADETAKESASAASKEKPVTPSKTKPAAAETPSKAKKLEISKPKHFVNYVDLESSSSEDDVQFINKADKPEQDSTPRPEEVTVNISKEIHVISNNTTSIKTKGGEIIIEGLTKPSAPKVARLNTDEISIKTATSAEPLVIPEAKIPKPESAQETVKFDLEVFNLDSDDDEDKSKFEMDTINRTKAVEKCELVKSRVLVHCINPFCTSDANVKRIKAEPALLRFYDVKRRKKQSQVCESCADYFAAKFYDVLEGVRSLEPLLDLNLSRNTHELVEISSSDTESEDEESKEKPLTRSLGDRFLEDKLGDMLNETWLKYRMDERLRVTKDELDLQCAQLEKESKAIDAMLDECQRTTDKIRNDLYTTFARPSHCLPSLDLDEDSQSALQNLTNQEAEIETRRKRARLCKEESLPKLGPAPAANKDGAKVAIETKEEDSGDVSVLALSTESPPPELPPTGELVRGALQPGHSVYAARQAFRSWTRGKIDAVLGKNSANSSFTVYRVRYENKTQKSQFRHVPGKNLAYFNPPDVRLTIGTRVVALFKDSTEPNKKASFFPGVIAEIPNPVNKYRYLVFFDDGYAQYVRHADVRVTHQTSALVWEDVANLSRDFIRQYLLTYPARPMVRLHAGQSLNTEWNGKWWASQVTQVDASLVQVYFEADRRSEWIYRGSTRLAPLYLELQAAERTRARPMPRATLARRNMPYVEYTRSDEQDNDAKLQTERQKVEEEIKRQRAVAKKSTTLANLPSTVPSQPPDTVMSRVVYYTPKAAVKPHKMVPHICGPKCKRTDVLPLKELRTYNPLARPLLSGWERQIVRFRLRKEVMYRAPCGRRLRDVAELHRYLSVTQSEMAVDLFDFNVHTHCLAEFVLNSCLVCKKDLSHGKENVPVPCVNYYDNSLPEFCSYNTERTPTAGVPLNTDPEFLCGCDCTDDCQDKSKCACWKLTLEGARTIGMDDDIGYVYKRLIDPVPSGIYECNSRCKCKQTCLNRVAQHPLQLKLQVFKTLNRGWGIRALNDVPKGAFLCVYAGNLLTDATANLDGLNEGDEYLAELDYIEVVEQMKEGYEDDVPDKDKKLDKKESGSESEEDSSSSLSEDERNKEKADGDFRPEPHQMLTNVEFNKRLRRRERRNKVKEEKESEKKETNGEEECITISDDEEVREPSRFTAQAGMGGKEFVSKYRSVRTLFGKDEACYIMDAKVQGNIGRYLNHSCTPNVFVQNVFVDTHDPRFPWVAFFALSHIKAGAELTWNYNYDVGSVPGKCLYCYCGAPNCRGRLL